MEKQTPDMDLIAALDGEESSFDIRNVINFIWRLKWVIMACVLLALSIGYLYYKSQIPIYSSTSKVMFIDYRTTATNTSIVEDITGIKHGGKKDDEVIVMKSPSLMTKVVDHLGLNTTYYQYRLPLFHSSFPVFRSLLNIKKYEFYQDAPFGMEVFFGEKEPSYVDVEFRAVDEGRFSLTKISAASQTLEFEKGKVYSYSDTLLLGGVKVKLSHLKDYKMIRGDVFQAVYQNSAALGEQFSRRVNASIEFSSNPNNSSNIMNVSFWDNNPRRATDVANTLIYEYNKDAVDYKSRSYLNAIQFINDRLSEIVSDLDDVEGEYIDYQSRYGYIGESADLSTVSLEGGYEQRLKELGMRRAMLNLLKEEVAKTTAGEYRVLPMTVGNGVEDGGLGAVLSEYNTLVTDRDRLAINSSASNPSVMKYNDKLEVALENIRQAIGNLEKIYVLRESELMDLSMESRQKRTLIPEQMQNLSNISRRQKIIEPLFLQLSQKREEIQLSIFSIPDNVRVIEPAKYNSTPVSPKQKKISLYAIVLGILIPILLVIAHELLRTKVETKEDVKRYLKYPILATIPKCDISRIAGSGGRDQISESFRNLRANLRYVSGRVIQVTSSMPAEGKSFISANLALSISHIHKKVVLVGLDLRRPVLHKAFPEIKRVHNRSVVSYLIGKNDDPASLAVPYINDDCRLDIILSGPVPPNPTELLSMERLAMLLNYCRQTYEYVIIDTAPLMPVADAAIVNEFVDETFYVIRADYSELKMIRDLRDILAEGKLKNVKLLFNGIDLNSAKYHYGYGYDYGRYGYGRYGYGHYGYGYGYGYGSGDGASSSDSSSDKSESKS